MLLYMKSKKDFIKVEDYATVRIGSIVKVYSEKSERFINKTPYFVSAIGEDDIVLDSNGKKLNYNISSRNLSLK